MCSDEASTQPTAPQYQFPPPESVLGFSVLTCFLLLQLEHRDQSQTGTKDQGGDDAQHDAHDHSGVVVIGYGSHIVRLPVDKHLQQWKRSELGVKLWF